MTTERVYLRPNVQVEPLIDQWYAWSQLIPPATAARNVTERHLRIMDSYIGGPHVHAAAVKDPRMFDPVLSYTYESDISRYTYADLPDVIDYAIITHNHQDHVLLETMIQIRHRVRHVVVPPGSGALQDPSLRLALEHIGFTSVIELDEMEAIAIPMAASPPCRFSVSTRI